MMGAYGFGGEDPAGKQIQRLDTNGWIPTAGFNC
jgi:hypothetical protein